MFDPTPPVQETLQPDLTVQTPKSEVEILFPFPVTDTEKALVPRKVLPPTRGKVRIIFLSHFDEQKTSRLPNWLHALIGWGVFLAILAGFLGLQIYLNRLLSHPFNLIILCATVVAEMGLLWRWDQYWY